MSYPLSEPGLPLQEAVVWGPFPLRRARLVSGLAILAMGLLILLLGQQRHVLTCARSGVLAEQCEWRTGLRERSVRRFPLSALRLSRVVYSQTSNKGHVTHWGQLILDIGGRERAMPRQEVAAADASAGRLRTFLSDPAQQELRIDTGMQVGVLLMGGAFALAGAWLLYSVWYGRRRFRLTWDALTQQLSMQLLWPPGIAKGPPQTWTLPKPVEVEISWEEVQDAFTSSRSPGPRGGRLLVRLQHGGSEALLPAPMPGYRVHIRAAEGLRALLRCPPRSPDAAARIEDAYAAERPKLGPGWTGLGGQIAVTWLGACCGALAGIALGGVLGLLLGAIKLSDSADGPWFFGGMFGGIAAGIALAWRLLLRPDER